MRRSAVRERLARAGEVDIAELAVEFAVSEMTIRRDLEALEAEGVARRVRGGAISVVSRSYEPPFEARRTANVAVKAALGVKAADLVDDGQTVILDTGTTVLETARALRTRGMRLTVVTPSLLAGLELADEPDMRVMLTGGTIRPGEHSLVGPEAESTFTDLNCDVAFLGVAGVDVEHGLTEYNLDEARVKRAQVRSARRIVALADTGKLGRVHFAGVAPLGRVDVLVTDAAPDHPLVCDIRTAGVDVITLTEKEKQQ
jgi:DeoR/GlpR family transcriptional regulator of sugar metabolism